MAQLKDLLVTGAARFLNGIFVMGDITATNDLTILGSTKLHDVIDFGYDPTAKYLNFTGQLSRLNHGGLIQLYNGNGDGNSTTAGQRTVKLQLFTDSSGGNIRLYSEDGRNIYTADSSGNITLGNHNWLIYSSAGNLTFNNRYGGSTTSASVSKNIQFHSYGGITANNRSVSWLQGQSTNTAALNITNATDGSGYWPWIRQINSNTSKQISVGIYSNSLYFVGSNTTRTENGYDYGWQYNFANGNTYLNCGAATNSEGNQLVVNGRIIVNPVYATKNDYTQGIRINRASDGWSLITLGGDGTNGSDANTWIMGRRGVAGTAQTTYGGNNSSRLTAAVNDFTIELNSSYGLGLTLPCTNGESPTWQQRPIVAQLLHQATNTIVDDPNYKTAYVATVSKATDNMGLAANSYYHILNFRHLDNNGYNGQFVMPLNHDGYLAWRRANGVTWKDWNYIFDDRHNLIPAVDITYDIGSTGKKWKNAYINILHIRGAATNVMDKDTTNPRIIFSENGGQAVQLVYTDYDSYRASKGLKVGDADGSDAGNVWFETQGSIYLGTTNTAADATRTEAATSLFINNWNALTGYDSTLRINKNRSFTDGVRLDGGVLISPISDNPTLKIYSAMTVDGKDDGAIAMQTAIDGVDGEIHAYAASYPLRESLCLQPRGGSVWIGATPGMANPVSPANWSTSNKLFVDGGSSSSTVKTGQLILSTQVNGSSGTVSLELWRGNNASWQMMNNGGILSFNNNYSSSTAQSSYNRTSLQLTHGTGAGRIPYLAIGELNNSDSSKNIGFHTDYRLYVSGTTYTNNQVYINYNEDVGLDDKGSLIIGDKAGLNIGIDANEIMARNNQAASTLYVNAQGGNIYIGKDAVTFNYLGEKSTTALYTFNGHVVINPAYNETNNYSEGLRINAGSNDWSTITLGGAGGSTTGTGATVWLLGTTGGTFYLSHNGKDSATTRMQGSANGFIIHQHLGINGENTDYALYVKETNLSNVTQPSLIEGLLKIGTYTDQSTVYSGGIYVWDIRNATINPNSFTQQAASFYFDQQINNKWKSILHVDGWQDSSYSCWELAGNAHNTNNDVDQHLWMRSGVGTSWGNWTQLADSRTNYEYTYTDTIAYDAITRKFSTSKTDNSWNAQAYSNFGYTDGCILSFKAGSTSGHAMAGLNKDPATDANYTGIDYCWYLKSSGELAIYESGSSFAVTKTSYAVGDEFVIEYSNEIIKYYCNGVLYRATPRVPDGNKLYFDSSFHSAKNIYDVRFEPIRGGRYDLVHVYNSKNLRNSTVLTVNDLALQGSAVAMINAATNNPTGEAKWVHVWSQAWDKGVNSSWVSQLALGTANANRLYYRTTSGTIINKEWTTVYDNRNDIIPVTSVTYNIGDTTHLFNNAYMKALSIRHIDAGEATQWTDSELYIGYGAIQPTKKIRMYYSSSTSSRTEFLQINSNGAYALTRFGVNGQNLSYNFYVNGTGYIFARAASANAEGLVLENGLLVIKNYNNTLTIGSYNSEWIHFQSNDAKPFWFNNTVHINGDLMPYNTTNTRNLGSTSKRWAKLYIGTADSYGGASTAPIYWNAGVPAAVSNISLVASDTTGKYVEAGNSNGKVRIFASTNRGLYDTTSSAWIVYNNTTGANTYIPLWASKGSTATPVYFNSNGEPVACSYSLNSTVASGTQNRAAYYSAATTLASSGHYMSSSKLAINSTSEPSYNLYINGTTMHNGINYFANGTTYYINNSAEGNLAAFNVQNQYRVRTTTTPAYSGTNAETNTWWKVAQVSSYFNFDIYLTGGWSSGSPSVLVVNICNRNGTVYITQKSGIAGALNGQIKLGKTATNTWDVLFLHTADAAGATHASQSFSFTGVGNITVYKPTEPDTTTYDTSKTLAFSTIDSSPEQRYVKKAGDTMTGSLKMGTTSTTNGPAVQFYSNKRNYIWMGYANDNGNWYLWDTHNGQGIITSTLSGTNTFHGHASSDLALSGGTMTGILRLWGSQYTGPTGSYGLHCNNSDIVGINGLFNADLADSFSEGYNFYRSSTTYDAMAANGGTFYFGSNVAFGAALAGSAIINAGRYIANNPNGLRLVGGSGTTKSMLFRNDGSNFYILCCNSAADGDNWYTPTGGGHPFRINLETGYVYTTRLYGAVWNDYAEYRNTTIAEPGQCVIETGLGNLILSTARLQPGANIVSDTFGFAIGETETTKTPIAVSGRVLAYPYEDRYSYKAGDPVCSGPNGTVSRMTREEVREYPDRIVGTVSEIPEYETWGTGNIKVNKRIWIRIK